MIAFIILLAFLSVLQPTWSLASPNTGDEACDEQRTAKHRFVNMAYWPYQATSKLSEFNAGDITHIVYHSAKVGEDGYVDHIDEPKDVGKNLYNLGGKWAKLFHFKQQNRHIKTLLSIGGEAAHDETARFLEAGRSWTSRSHFAESAVRMMLNGGFDGICIDWRYPFDHTCTQKDSDSKMTCSGSSSTESESWSHARLVRAVRQELDKLKSEHDNYRFLLTITVSHMEFIYQHLQFRQLVRDVDYWHMLSYDYAGDFSTTAQHNANYEKSLDNYASTDWDTRPEMDKMCSRYHVSKRTIVMGVPAHAHVYRGARNPGDEITEDGYLGRRPLRALDQNKLEMNCDDHAMACMGYDASTGELISLETKQSMRQKSEVMRDKAFAGIFVDNLDQDLPGNRSLLATSAEVFGQLEKSLNHLDYHDSRFVNMRERMKGYVPIDDDDISTTVLSLTATASPTSFTSTMKPSTSHMTTSSKPSITSRLSTTSSFPSSFTSTSFKPITSATNSTILLPSNTTTAALQPHPSASVKSTSLASNTQKTSWGTTATQVASYVSVPTSSVKQPNTQPVKLPSSTSSHPSLGTVQPIRHTNTTLILPTSSIHHTELKSTPLSLSRSSSSAKLPTPSFVSLSTGSSFSLATPSQPATRTKPSSALPSNLVLRPSFNSSLPSLLGSPYATTNRTWLFTSTTVSPRVSVSPATDSSHISHLTIIESESSSTHATPISSVTFLGRPPTTVAPAFSVDVPSSVSAISLGSSVTSSLPTSLSPSKQPSSHSLHSSHYDAKPHVVAPYPSDSTSGSMAVLSSNLAEPTLSQKDQAHIRPISNAASTFIVASPTSSHGHDSGRYSAARLWTSSPTSLHITNPSISSSAGEAVRTGTAPALNLSHTVGLISAVEPTVPLEASVLAAHHPTSSQGTQEVGQSRPELQAFLPAPSFCSAGHLCHTADASGRASASDIYSAGQTVPFSVSVVLVTHVTMSVCAAKKSCSTGSPLTLTRHAYMTDMPIGATQLPQTISLAPDVGTEPFTVNVGQRTVTMCVSELGCRQSSAAESPALTKAEHSSLGQSDHGTPAQTPFAETTAKPMGKVCKAAPTSVKHPKVIDKANDKPSAKSTTTTSSRDALSEHMVASPTSSGKHVSEGEIVAPSDASSKQGTASPVGSGSHVSSSACSPGSSLVLLVLFTLLTLCQV
uniref:chitinase n=1 Tax=Hirsutella thompsonii TaxID=42368 RepID=A0A097F8N3_HIRTH|nr:glycoside hydrolase family 18 [Hirsutella thompsonii]